MNYFIFFISALAASYAATPYAMKFAAAVGAIDVPKDERRMHSKPIPLLGGLSIATGFMSSLLIWLMLFWLGITDFNLADRKLIGLVFGILIILAVGIVDDIRPLGAKVRLTFQTLAALVVALAESKIQFISNPFSEFGIIAVPPVISIIVTVFWIVGMTNAVNLIDGLDGLAAGVSLVSAISLFIISIIRADYVTASLLAAFAGSIAGFLPRNFHPAKVFMGSSGAYFLGFVISVIALTGSIKAYTTISLVLPLLILGLPIFDTLFAIARRLIGRKRISESDRGHIHHRLVDAGFTHLQSVLLLIGISVLLGLASILITDKHLLPSLLVIASTIISLIMIFIIISSRDKFEGILSRITARFTKKTDAVKDTGEQDEQDEQD